MACFFIHHFIGPVIGEQYGGNVMGFFFASVWETLLFLGGESVKSLKIPLFGSAKTVTFRVILGIENIDIICTFLCFNSVDILCPLLVAARSYTE